MKNKILFTNDNWTGFVTRFTVGLILFPHGAQSLLGWFGGAGYTQTMHGFTTYFNLPYIIGLLVILIEFFGAIFLIIGFAGRFWAGAVIILFIGMILTVHREFGFFMNWYGDKKGEGFEYHLLVIGLCVAILIGGSGKFSIDRNLSKQERFV